MAVDPPPPFLRGTFAWNFLGYALAEPPPTNLLSAEALSSSSPWVVLAAVLERAKRGDHGAIPRLRSCFDAGSDEGPERACLHLIGDAGREVDLPILREWLEQGPDRLRAFAAGAAAMSGRLWLVPSMLEAWKRAESREPHTTIGRAISTLMEEQSGPISQNADLYNLSAEAIARLKNPAMQTMAERRAAEDPVTEFETLVEARYEELRGQFGDQAVLWRGQPFSVSRLVGSMYDLVRNPEVGPLQGLFIPMRHRFEAATGIDCSECFANGVLQPLSAAAVLETFLESEASTRYEEGVRYFWGHRIPG
jgi:hypothetical protein